MIKPKSQTIDKLIAQRGQEYGSFCDNAKRAMQFYYANASITTQLESLLKLKDYEIDMIRFFVFMIGAKLARLQANPTHKDSIQDLLGYARIFKQSCKQELTLKALDESQQPFIDIIHEELQK